MSHDVDNDTNNTFGDFENDTNDNSSNIESNICFDITYSNAEYATGAICYDTDSHFHNSEWKQNNLGGLPRSMSENTAEPNVHEMNLRSLNLITTNIFDSISETC